MSKETALPKNIRQIGEIQGEEKICVEDYVMTCIRKKEPDEKEGFLGIFYGDEKKTEEGDFVFIRGILEVSKEWEEGELGEKLEELRQKYFSELEPVGCCVVGQYPTERMKKVEEQVPASVRLIYHFQEQEENLYWTLDGRYKKLKGYFIFYEQNRKMQQYLADVFPEDSVEKESTPDEAIRSFREKVREKGEKKTGSMLKLASSFFVMTVLIIGAVVVTRMDDIRKARTEVGGGSAPAENESGDHIYLGGTQNISGDSMAVSGTQVQGGNMTASGGQTQGEAAQDPQIQMEGENTLPVGNYTSLDIPAADSLAAASSENAAGAYASDGMDGQGLPDVPVSAGGQSALDAGVNADGQGLSDVSVSAGGQSVSDVPVSADGQSASDVPVSADGQNASDVPVSADSQNDWDVSVSTDGQNASDVPVSADGQNASDVPVNADGQISSALPAGTDSQNAADVLAGAGSAGQDSYSQSGTAAPQSSASQDDGEASPASSRQVMASYTIREGDTLADICNKYYGSLDKLDFLCQENNITDANMIMPGQKIVLP